MDWWLPLALLAAASGQQNGVIGAEPGSATVRGPSLVCGENFALRLAAGESLAFRLGPDFYLYYATAADGAFVLYEGGYPQPHDDVIRVNDHTLIAIHDNRPEAARQRTRVRDRLIVGPGYARACPNGFVQPGAGRR